MDFLGVGTDRGYAVTAVRGSVLCPGQSQSAVPLETTLGVFALSAGGQWNMEHLCDSAVHHGQVQERELKTKQGASSELCHGLICVSVPFAPSERSASPLATTISVRTKRIIPRLGSSTTTSCSGCPCMKSSPWRPWWGRAVCLTCTPTAKVRIEHVPEHVGSGLWWFNPAESSAPPCCLLPVGWGGNWNKVKPRAWDKNSFMVEIN